MTRGTIVTGPWRRVESGLCVPERSASSGAAPTSASSVSSAGGSSAVRGRVAQELGRSLPAGARARGDHEGDHGTDEDQRRHPGVDPQTEDVVRVVDAQQLDPEPPDGVERDVQHERATVPEPEPPVRPHHDGSTGQAPQRLVQERRLERRVRLVAGRAVRHVDLQPPRQRRRLAEQLLVEPVPPAAHRLRDEERRRGRVRERRQHDALAAAADVRPDAARGRWRPRCPGRPPRSSARRPGARRTRSTAARW